jgi:hypothetical protein
MAGRALRLICASEIKHLLTVKTLKVATTTRRASTSGNCCFSGSPAMSSRTTSAMTCCEAQEDEFYARQLYAEHYAPVQEVGFVTNDSWGFTIGYSPDALVGDDGLIECKSRRGKFQIQTIAENEVPEEYVLQLQTGLLVTGRKWIDFISYSGGLPMFVKRVEPDLLIQGAILAAATAFEAKLAEKEREYRATIATMPKVIETERRIIQEMF